MKPMECFPCVWVERAGYGCRQGKQGLAWEKEVEQEEEGATNLRATTGALTCSVGFRGRQIQRELPPKWYEVLGRYLETAGGQMWLGSYLGQRRGIVLSG